MYYNWQYISIELGSRPSGGSRRETHSNFEQLQCVIILQNGEKVILRHELYPWQETPSGWEYGLEEQGEFVLYVDGN